MQVVHEAGDIARKFFNEGAKSWDKNPGDPVTEADLAINDHLQQRLCSSRPNYGWLSEETADDLSRLDRHRVWIIDPIDGTRAFIAGRAEFTICAGLVEDGRPLLGAVFNPITQEFFDAIKNGGARCNGKTLKTRDGVSLGNARLLASQRVLERQKGIGALPSAQFKFINSIAYRMALVALDQFDATISLATKNDWDTAAAELIVTEAGGRVTAPDGSALTYNQADSKHTGVVAAAPALCQEILDRL